MQKRTLVEGVLQDDGRTVVAEPAVVGERVHPSGERSLDRRAAGDKEVDAEVDAAPLDLGVEQRRVAVEHPVLVVAADPDRDVVGHDPLEQVLGEGHSVVDADMLEVAVGAGEVEHGQLAARQVDRDHVRQNARGGARGLRRDRMIRPWWDSSACPGAAPDLSCRPSFSSPFPLGEVTIPRTSIEG